VATVRFSGVRGKVVLHEASNARPRKLRIGTRERQVKTAEF
jgi:hypothetical protein